MRLIAYYNMLYYCASSRAVRRPIKVIWSPKEDIRQDQYRQAAAARLKEVLVVKISLKNGLPAVQRIVCATDCGVIINPRILEAQIQGCIHDGLWSSLHAKITIQKGRVQQHNFDNYPLLRLGEMPDVEVYLVTNDAPPAGAGELATPLVAPAIANALFVLTGQRIRKLPFSDHPIRDSHLA